LIWFNSEKARKQLINKGVVVSARPRRKQTGITKAIYKNDEGERIEFAKVKVTIVNESSCVDTLTHRPVLKDYLHLSGFHTVREWEDEICIMNRGNRMPLYLKLVRVEIIELF